MINTANSLLTKKYIHALFLNRSFTNKECSSIIVQDNNLTGVYMLNVMIADDEEIERKFLKSLLDVDEDAYCVVCEAANGEEAVNLAKIHKPDVVIMDINMPVYDGIEAARIIKKDSRGTIIILNSAYAEFDFARRAIDFNLDAYLVKPAQENEILETIKRCTGKKKIGQPGVLLTTNKDIMINAQFPFHTVDHILDGINRKNCIQIKSSIEEFLTFLKLQHTNLPDYRLFIINTIFSIERTLHESKFQQNLVSLLESNRYLQNISQTTEWYAILSEMKNYFHRLITFMEGVNENNRDKMEVILEYIEHRFTEDISLDTLSELVFLSSTYVSHLFHQKTGTSIRDFLNQKRIEYACTLLSNSKISIKEVAEKCGYANLTHFYRIFKRIMKITPLEFRNEDN